MIKHILANTILWCAIVATLPLYAQQHENTLGSLWPQVEANYPGVGVKTSSVEAAQLHEQAVRDNRLPQVRAQVQNTYGTYAGSSGAFFSLPGLFNVSGAPNVLTGSSTSANSFGSATVEWELFSFGKLRKENEAANSLLNKTISEKEAYLLNLKKILSERYISLLYNDAKLNWSEKNAERLNDIRNITVGLSAAGLKPVADSLLASSSYIQAMGEYDKWNGFKDASFIKLLELYDADDVDYSPSGRRFINPSLNSFNPLETVNPSHPVLSALDKQSQFFASSGKAMKQSLLPSLRLLGGYAYRGTGINPNHVSGAWKDGFNNSVNNFVAGIGITWNITNLHTNKIKSHQLFKEAEGVRLLHSQYEQAMQADLSALQAKIRKQYQQLQKTILAVKQSGDAYEMYLARYKSGLISLSELLQIRLLLEQAENTHIEAARDYWSLLANEAELTADFDFLFNNL